jgi:hypothetical protein
MYMNLTASFVHRKFTAWFAAHASPASQLTKRYAKGPREGTRSSLALTLPSPFQQQHSFKYGTAKPVPLHCY